MGQGEGLLGGGEAVEVGWSSVLDGVMGLRREAGSWERVGRGRPGGERRAGLGFGRRCWNGRGREWVRRSGWRGEAPQKAACPAMALWTKARLEASARSSKPTAV